MSQTGRTPRLLHGCGNTFKFTSNLLSLHCWVCTLFAFTVFGHLSTIYINSSLIIICSSAVTLKLSLKWRLTCTPSQNESMQYKHMNDSFSIGKKSHRIKRIRTRISDLYCNGSWFSLPSLRMNMELQHGKVQALSPDPCIVQCVDCLTSCGFCNFHYLICWISINQCGFKQPRCPGSIWSSCAKRISKHAPTQATLANQCQCLATGTDHFFACVRIPAPGTKVAEASNLIQYKFLYVWHAGNAQYSRRFATATARTASLGSRS